MVDREQFLRKPFFHIFLIYFSYVFHWGPMDGVGHNPRPTRGPVQAFPPPPGLQPWTSGVSNLWRHLTFRDVFDSVSKSCKMSPTFFFKTQCLQKTSEIDYFSISHTLAMISNVKFRKALKKYRTILKFHPWPTPRLPPVVYGWGHAWGRA